MPHILIADSSEDVAQLVSVALSLRGFATEILVRGEELFRPPDVLVLDAGLRDAAELVDELRARIPRLPVVATGIRSLDGRRPPLGALVYLVKPFSLTDLAAAVRAAAPT
jgi:DNA-binding response OmpR family regulator